MSDDQLLFPALKYLNYTAVLLNLEMLSLGNLQARYEPKGGQSIGFLWPLVTKQQQITI